MQNGGKRFHLVDKDRLDGLHPHGALFQQGGDIAPDAVPHLLFGLNVGIDAFGRCGGKKPGIFVEQKAGQLGAAAVERKKIAHDTASCQL